MQDRGGGLHLTPALTTVPGWLGGFNFQDGWSELCGQDRKERFFPYPGCELQNEWTLPFSFIFLELLVFRALVPPTQFGCGTPKGTSFPIKWKFPHRPPYPFVTPSPSSSGPVHWLHKATDAGELLGSSWEKQRARIFKIPKLTLSTA